MHACLGQQYLVCLGTAVWMRSLPMVLYGNDWLLVSGRIEHRSASWAMYGSGSMRFVVNSIALDKCVGLATWCLLHWSCFILTRYWPHEWCAMELPDKWCT